MSPNAGLNNQTVAEGSAGLVRLRVGPLRFAEAFTATHKSAAETVAGNGAGGTALSRLRVFAAET